MIPGADTSHVTLPKRHVAPHLDHLDLTKKMCNKSLANGHVHTLTISISSIIIHHLKYVVDSGPSIIWFMNEIKLNVVFYELAQVPQTRSLCIYFGCRIYTCCALNIVNSRNSWSFTYIILV